MLCSICVFLQVVIAGRSSMVGQTIRQLRFRTLFDAAVIAVHRQGHRVRAKIGDIVLQAGDVLLLDTGPAFLQKHRRDTSFALVAEVENSSPPKFDKVCAVESRHKRHALPSSWQRCCHCIRFFHAAAAAAADVLLGNLRRTIRSSAIPSIV